MAEKVLMKGNEAIAEAAIMAGCRHYFGYPITPQTEIAAYIASGEPMDKAGAYAIQGEFGQYIEGFEGDYRNVVGLPYEKVYDALKELDY